MKKIFLLVMFTFSSLVFGFECTNPGRDVEKFICENTTLSSLNDLHNQYGKKVGDVKPGEVREINQDLYFDLNKCDNDVQCISSSYSKSMNSFIKVIEENKSQFVSSQNNVNSGEGITNKKSSEKNTTSIKFDENKIFYVISILCLLLISLSNLIIFYIKKFSTSSNGIIKVCDGFQIIYFSITTIFLLFVCVLVISKLEVGIIGMSLIVSVYLLFNYSWYLNHLGYVVNTNNNTFSFPTYLFRKTIPMSSIKSIDKKEEFHQELNKKGEMETYYLYYLDIVTVDHSGYNFKFYNSIDSERLYSALSS